MELSQLDREMDVRKLEILMPADIDEIPGLFAKIERFGVECGVSGDAIFKVQLALDELINNAIDHGYHGRPPGEISVHISHDGNSIDIELSDDATLFDPFSVATPDLGAGIEDRPLGGLGVHLVRTLMNNTAYSVRNARNCVRLNLVLGSKT